MLLSKEKILVPEGIRYLSDWGEFSLSSFPSKCIIDKQLPGCGFTEYCITSPLNIILASPRKRLIKNKYDQHMEDSYLVDIKEQEDLRVDRDIEKSNKTKTSVNSDGEESINKDKDDLDTPIFTPGQSFLEKLNKILDQNGILPDKEKNVYIRIYREIESYINRMNMYGKPYKILVTYDSYRLVKEILTRLGVFETFYSVVDEFQSILHDSRFKSSTELGFLEYLKQSPTAYFVSATPMLDDYLEMLDEFNGLPYFELDWATLDPGRIVKPNLKVLTMKSVGTKAKEVIQSYLDGDFERVVIQDKETGELKEVVSDEAVLFMNSVKHIVSIVKKMGLTPDQVTILCADTRENRRLIEKKLGKKFLVCISDIPLKGVKPKMFTFCTRTTYLGADFYSLCARTFIFSDSNLDCLAVDISDDLPQILGRQRLEENPWKNSATFYYRSTADYKSMEAEDFEKKILDKKESTDSLLRTYGNIEVDFDKNKLAEAFRDLARSLFYEKSYVAVNEYYTPELGVKMVPVFNNLVLVNEIRAFKIAQIDYKDRFSVFAKIREKFGAGLLNRPDEDIIYEFLEKYESTTTITGRYKLLCENDLPKETIDYILNQLQDSDIVKSNYIALGPEKLKSIEYNKTKIDDALGKVVFNKDILLVNIFNHFTVGDNIPAPIVKESLSKIYKDSGCNKTAKVNSFSEYFNVKESSLTLDLYGTGVKKRIRCYEILSVRSEYQEIYNQVKGI